VIPSPEGRGLLFFLFFFFFLPLSCTHVGRGSPFLPFADVSLVCTPLAPFSFPSFRVFLCLRHARAGPRSSSCFLFLPAFSTLPFFSTVAKPLESYTARSTRRMKPRIFFTISNLGYNAATNTETRHSHPLSPQRLPPLLTSRALLIFMSSSDAPIPHTPSRPSSPLSFPCCATTLGTRPFWAPALIFFPLTDCGTCSFSGRGFFPLVLF